MKHRYYSLLIAIGFSTYFITGCSKDCHKPEESKDLIGSWKWVRTDGGIGNNIHDTPASTGKNVELILTSNSKYSLLTDGITTSEGTFTLPVRNCIHDGSNKRVIDFSETSVTDQMVESIGNNVLTLSDDYLDGTVSEFVKIKSPSNFWFLNSWLAKVLGTEFLIPIRRARFYVYLL